MFFLPCSLYRKRPKLNATLCRDSATQSSSCHVCSVSAPCTQIRGCSALWIIHLQCACHQTRSTYCQPTITQTTLSALPPAWHCSDYIVFPSFPEHYLISPPAIMCSLLHKGGPLSRNLHWNAEIMDYELPENLWPVSTFQSCPVLIKCIVVELSVSLSSKNTFILFLSLVASLQFTT
jgi:hypothetical protein